LFKGCRNFIVEINAKYLMEMLNNPEKMLNATINRWVDYIRTNFFFKIVYKKEKTFGPDGLSRRKWYPGDLLQKYFTDGTDNGTGDIVVRKKDPKSLNPLELEEFYKEIDSREGFFHESIEKEPLLELERNLVEDSKRSNSNKTRDIFLETASEESEQDLESSREEYDDNRRSDHAKRVDERIKQIRELLATKSWTEKGSRATASSNAYTVNLPSFACRYSTYESIFKWL